MKIGREAISEIFQYLLLGLQFLKDAEKATPEGLKKRMPGFLGLSLKDEQIFNGLLPELSLDDQIIIKNFLCKACLDYERNRFINVVAGMDVEEWTPPVTEKGSSETGETVDDKSKTTKIMVDRRVEFLKNFAKIIREKLNEDYRLAKEYCLAGRIIIENPIHEKLLRFWREDVKAFKEFILKPMGAKSLSEITLEKAKEWANYCKSKDESLAQIIRNETPERPGFFKSVFGKEKPRSIFDRLRD